MTDFCQSFIKIIELWPATKMSYQLTFENVGQGHHLQKIIISLLLYDRFEQNFHQNDATEADNSSLISVDLENVGQGNFS